MITMAVNGIGWRTADTSFVKQTQKPYENHLFLLPFPFALFYRHLSAIAYSFRLMHQFLPGLLSTAASFGSTMRISVLFLSFYRFSRIK